LRKGGADAEIWEATRKESIHGKGLRKLFVVICCGWSAAIACKKRKFIEWRKL
jgi:hypothetical protein